MFSYGEYARVEIICDCCALEACNAKQELVNATERGVVEE